MTVKDYKKFNELSKVFNETFGAQNKLDKSVNTEMVRTKLINEEKMQAFYICIVNLQTENMWKELEKKNVDDALEVMRQYFKKCVEEYKKNTGKNINFTIDSKTVRYDVEFLNYNILRTNRSAYFRVYCDVDIK